MGQMLVTVHYRMQGDHAHFRHDMTKAAGLIAGIPGLVWKIWLEDRATGHAGGIYLFENAVSAERYREKHARRLAAMGIDEVSANVFAVNPALSVLTLAGSALGHDHATKSLSAPVSARL